MTFNTYGVVVKYQQFRDFDRIYTVYTQDFGKLPLLARGSNRIKSKLAGHLEPGCLSYLMIAQGRGLEVLAQARTHQSFCRVRENPEKWLAVQVALESLDVLTFPSDRELNLFDLLVNLLNRFIQTESRTDIKSLIYYYLLWMLIHLGHAPEMRHEVILRDLLVADLVEDDIIVSREAQELIAGYLARALDERRINSWQEWILPESNQKIA